MIHRIYAKRLKFIKHIWHAPQSVPFFILRAPVFAVFIIAEWLYRLGLLITRIVHKIFIAPYRFSKPVIVVGNISSGGTGKSVFVSYLVKIVGEHRCGIVTRGYGGVGCKHAGIVTVDMVEEYGDEACMLAMHHPSSVVVAARRKRDGLKFLETTNIDYAIIDDGYQTLGIDKDLTFVLLDGRRPFENGHCLPAGPLREKDVSRAQVVVVTHAAAMTDVERERLRARLKHPCVLWGKHTFMGLFCPKTGKTEMSAPKGERFCVVAAIGSITGFLDMLAENNVICVQIHEFADHHTYSVADVAHISAQAGDHPFVTTFKDWVKLAKLVPKNEWHRWRVVYVEFSFLSATDEALVCEKLSTECRTGSGNGTTYYCVHDFYC